jgi:hypothetical protein
MRRSVRKMLKLKGGFEFDYLTGWRKWYQHKSGQPKAAKQSFNRRFRRKAKQKLDHEA